MSMLIVRNEKFVKSNNMIYIVGSSSNALYRNNAEQMGPISILGWQLREDEVDITKLEVLEDNPSIRVILHPNEAPFLEKVKMIREEVQKAEALSIKFCFVDSFIACHFSNRFKKPYVIESGTDASSSWYHGGSIKYKLITPPYQLITKYYHKKAKYIIYVSKHFLQKKYPSRATQIGCSDAVISPVDETVLMQRIERIERLSDLQGSHKIVLGLIGAASVAYRGHERLIKVAKILKDKGYEAEVRFLGNDKGKETHLKTALDLGISDSIFFDGYRTKQGVFEWIDNIDVLVMPTLQETLGRAVIEAMSRGCPVIGSLETALPEQIGSDCIVSAKDVDGIAQILEHMLLDNEYMQYCAYENYYRAKKYYSKVSNSMKKKFYDTFFIENDLR